MIPRLFCSPLTKGIVVILTAIFLFDIMGAIIKHMGDRYPVPQLAMFRNLFALVPGVIVLYYSNAWNSSGRWIIIQKWKLALMRGGMVAIAQFCFYKSLMHMEFATASSIAFAGPLFITALSIPILHHQVGISRWIAVIIGFVGIILVINPTNADFSWVMLLPLGAAMGYASSSVCARLFDESVSTASINLYATVGALICSTTLMVASNNYVPIVSAQDWFWLISMGIAGGTAVFCLITAYRLTEPSNLSPFEYFGIPFSFILGWVFFGEAPFDRLIPGVFLIIGGGLVIVWRDYRKNQQTKDEKLEAKSAISMQ